MSENIQQNLFKNNGLSCLSPLEERRRYQVQPQRKNSRLGMHIEDIKSTKISWLWEGWLPRGKLVIIDGDPGVGKSTMICADIPARLANGLPMPDGSDVLKGTECRTLIISAEDDASDTLKPRLLVAGTDKNVVIGNGMFEGNENQEAWCIRQNLDILREELVALRIDFLVLDPLVALLGANANYDHEVRNALGPLAVVLQQTNVCCIGIKHPRKAATSNPLYKGGGSIGMIASARVGLMAGRSKTDADSCVLAMTKNNVAPLARSLSYTVVSDKGVSKIKWLGSSSESAEDLVSEFNGRVKTRSSEANDFLLDELANGPVAASTIIEKALIQGINETTLNRAKKSLGIESKREGFGSEGSFHWSVP